MTSVPLRGCQKTAPNATISAGRVQERHVSVLPDALRAFCAEAGLSFDERALLEHLLLEADWRSGELRGFTLTGLAADVGRGPSGRRTLAVRLDRLAAAGAVAWSPGAGGNPGRLVVLVYRQLVRVERDSRRGWVQLMPDALAGYAAGRALSADAIAVLRRLLVEVGWCAQARPGPLRELPTAWGLGWARMARALGELEAAGAVERRAGTLHVAAYGQLVRGAPVLTTGGDRPQAAPPDRAGRVADSRAAAAGSRAAPGVLPPLTCVDKPLTLPAVVQDPERSPSTAEGQRREQPQPWERVASCLAPHHRVQVLVDVDQAGGRRLARRLLDELVQLVGDDAAVEQAAGDWPIDVVWPMGFLVNRLRMRVAEAQDDAGALARIVATEAEARAAAAAARESAALAAADLQRRQEIGEARRQGLDFVRLGESRETLAGLHAHDAEALAAALAGYDAGRDAWDHGADRARAGGDRFGLSDECEAELLAGAQAGYDAARVALKDGHGPKSGFSAPQEAREGPSAARAALRCPKPSRAFVAAAAGR